jgi:hypothetical protein
MIYLDDYKKIYPKTREQSLEGSLMSLRDKGIIDFLDYKGNYKFNLKR